LYVSLSVPYFPRKRRAVSDRESFSNAAVAGRTARTVNLGPIRPDAFSPRHPPIFEATMPRRHDRSDARDGGASSYDI
jgi:hypothetical protein